MLAGGLPQSPPILSELAGSGGTALVVEQSSRLQLASPKGSHGCTAESGRLQESYGKKRQHVR